MTKEIPLCTGDTLASAASHAEGNNLLSRHLSSWLYIIQSHIERELSPSLVLISGCGRHLTTPLPCYLSWRILRNVRADSELSCCCKFITADVTAVSPLI